jgi:hypothetical protein
MEEKDDQSKRPEDSAFKQQRLKAWQPLLTPFWVIATFFVIGVLFLILGGFIVKYSKDVVEVEVPYDSLTGCPEGTSACTLTIDIQDTMIAPVYIYYKLTNFYQNHRRYVKSRSDPQLSGDDISSVSSCDPLDSYSGVPLYPCGLIANSVFNDTFTATLTVGNTTVAMTEALGTWVKTGISWKSDRDKKFKKMDAPGFNRVGPGGFTLPDVDDEDFIVWMRTAGLPTFKKLYRKIESTDLNPGDRLTVTYRNVFPVKTFGGTKAIVLSTTSALGGKNDFLGFAYIAVGVVCLVLAIGFLVKHLYSPRTMGDMHYLNSWGSKQNVPARAGNQ